MVMRPVKDAILLQLREKSGVYEPINLLEIGPVLVSAGYSQEQIMYGLDTLRHSKVIEYLPGNRVQLLV
jgi:hypothetical protein